MYTCIYISYDKSCTDSISGIIISSLCFDLKTKCKF